MFTRYAVEIGDALWTALYSHVEGTYGIESVCEDSEQKFAVLNADEKYYRLDFSIAEDGSVVFAAEATELESYTSDEEPQFNAEAVAEYAKSKKEEKKPEDKEEPKDDEGEGEEKKCPKCGKKKSECECEDDDDSDEDDDDKKKKGKKEKYNLEEIQEYVELSANYSALETNYGAAQTRIAELEEQLAELTTFKKSVEKAEKEKLIASFYMLSDEDKKPVVENIDNYSLKEIEAELSILCVRNKVSFNLDDNKNDNKDPMTFSLNGGMSDEAPAWVKALRSVASEM